MTLKELPTQKPCVEKVLLTTLQDESTDPDCVGVPVQLGFCQKEYPFASLCVGRRLQANSNTVRTTKDCIAFDQLRLLLWKLEIK